MTATIRTKLAFVSCIMAGFAFGATAIGQSVQLGLVPDDGVPADEWNETYGRPGIQSTKRDIIIADQASTNIFFGFYRASQMTGAGWSLFNQSVDWVNDYGPRATTKVWLATYNGSLDPDFSAEKDGIAVYEHLIGPLGFDPANVHVDHQSSIETADFSGYDMVIYAWSYPRDATNVLDQGMPFLTFSAGETDEMGIGDGSLTMHSSYATNYCLDAQHNVTSSLGTGSFTLPADMWTDASTASGNGRVLVSADDSCLYLAVSQLEGGLNARFDVEGAPNGSNVAVVYGLSEGVTNVNNYHDYCATFEIQGVNESRVVDRGVIVGGVFGGRSYVPSSYSGTDVLFQAARRGTCPDDCMSNLVDRVIQ